MNYIEVKLLPVPCTEEICDVLAALLAPLGYDSFSNEFAAPENPDSAAASSAAEGVADVPTALKAYVPEQQWDSEALNALLSDLPLEGVEVAWVANVVEMQDWNQAWEESQQFEPIVIGEQCCVHSPALPADQVPACRYEVIIDPKMSFGSGTHETTSQLLEEILEVHDAMAIGRTLDMGTGTGVLGILCAEMGDDVRAIEIDDWVAANAVDNVLYNGLAGKMKVECGDASLLTEGPTYDLVLANINRNVLVADMPRYVAVMKPGATLLLSGFYEEDVPILRQCAESLGLEYIKQRSRNNWTVMRLRKA